MSDPLFSVIVPTRGRAAWLAAALESVRVQTVDDFECIIVADGGNEPVDIPHDSRFRLVRRDHRGGPAAARNTGLDNAHSRYIAFLDDDDLYTPQRLALACSGLQRAPIAVCGNALVDGPKGSLRVLEGDVSGVIGNWLTPHLGSTAVECAKVVRFDERFEAVEDVEWWLRQAQVAHVATVADVGFHYRLHRASLRGPKYRERVDCSLLLLDLHAAYFRMHRRAHAFRWLRIGLMADYVGDRSAARWALLRSLWLWPTPRTGWHLLRMSRPSTETLASRGSIYPSGYAAMRRLLRMREGLDGAGAQG